MRLIFLSSYSQSCLHCSYTCLLLHLFPSAPWLVDPFGFLPLFVHPYHGFLPLVFYSEHNVSSFDLCRKFALCFYVDIDEYDFCSCPSADPEILTQWMILEIVFFIDADDPLSICACSNCAWDICSADWVDLQIRLRLITCDDCVKLHIGAEEEDLKW